MLSLEQATKNVVYTKGLFSVPLEAFQFDWDKLNRIFVSTFHKYERFCPLLKTIQTSGGNPILMPEDCIYPRAIGFGNSSMITPQTVTVGSQDWQYNRETRRLSVFTNTGSSASVQVQYLAKHTPIDTDSDVDPVEVYEGDEEVVAQLNVVPELSTLQILYNGEDAKLTKRTRHKCEFEANWGTATLNLTSLELVAKFESATEGYLDVSFAGKYKAFDVAEDDVDFFENWYAANILSSLGNIKAVVRMEAMPNNINADELQSQGRALLEDVKQWQQEKQHWWKGYMGARV